MSLEDFMKPKSGNRRDRSRSKTITTTSSDDKLSNYPYTSDIENLVETSPQKPEQEDNHSAAPKLELDEGYAETSGGTTAVEVDKPQEVRLMNRSLSSHDTDTYCIEGSFRSCSNVHASRRGCCGDAMVALTEDVDYNRKL